MHFQSGLVSISSLGPRLVCLIAVWIMINLCLGRSHVIVTSTTAALTQTTTSCSSFYMDIAREAFDFESIVAYIPNNFNMLGN